MPMMVGVAVFFYFRLSSAMERRLEWVVDKALAS